MTTYSYYEIDSYEGSESFSWQLQAPDSLGVHVLYAREFHGNGGAYAADYSSGLVFTVTDISNGGDNGDDGTSVNLPTLIITSPSNSATVKDNITISASVTSVDEITSATLTIDRVCVSELTEAPFTWVVDTTNMTEGGHVIVVTVVDSTGDTVSKEIAVFVDNESELVSMLEWIVTMAAGTVVIVSASIIMVVIALYLRKRGVTRRRK